MTHTHPVHAAMARADQLIDLARYDEAEQLLKEAIVSEPHEPALFCLLSNCYYGADRYLEALDAAARAVALEPEDPWGHRLAALSFIQLKKKGAAVEAARTAVRLAPDEANLIVLSRALTLAKDWKAAYQAAYDARELDPQSADVHSNLGYLSLCRKRWSDAEAHLRRALEIDPNDAEAINNLGVALNARGRKSDALEAFARSSRTDPRISEARHNAATVARRYGGIGLAIALSFVIRVLSVGGRQAVREDGGGFAFPVIAAVLLLALAIAGLVVVWTIRKARRLEPGLARYVKEHQLSRVGLGPRAREHRWGLLFGLLLVVGVGTMGAVLAFTPDEPGWRVIGAIGLLAAATHAVFVARGWWPRRGRRG